MTDREKLIEAMARGWASARRPVVMHEEHRHDMADEIAAAIRKLKETTDDEA